MVGVVGVEWDLEEDLTSIEWDSVSGIDDDKVEAIREALIADEGEDVSDPKLHSKHEKCYNGALLFGETGVCRGPVLWRQADGQAGPPGAHRRRDRGGGQGAGLQGQGKKRKSHAR